MREIKRKEGGFPLYCLIEEKEKKKQNIKFHVLILSNKLKDNERLILS